MGFRGQFARQHPEPLMSALGQKQTLGRVRLMSALPPKADMDRHGRDVRFVPIADIHDYTGCHPISASMTKNPTT